MCLSGIAVTPAGKYMRSECPRYTHSYARVEYFIFRGVYALKGYFAAAAGKFLIFPESQPSGNHLHSLFLGARVESERV